MADTLERLEALKRMSSAELLENFGTPAGVNAEYERLIAAREVEMAAELQARDNEIAVLDRTKRILALRDSDFGRMAKSLAATRPMPPEPGRFEDQIRRLRGAA